MNRKRIHNEVWWDEDRAERERQFWEMHKWTVRAMWAGLITWFLTILMVGFAIGTSAWWIVHNFDYIKGLF